MFRNIRISGQSLKDRLNEASFNMVGDMLGRAVFKATTEEEIAPKWKHLQCLIKCTFSPRVSNKRLLSWLIYRTRDKNPLVVFKALMTINTLMVMGHENIVELVASDSCRLTLSLLSGKRGKIENFNAITTHA